MSETKTFTLADIADRNTKKDLLMVIHDKVYDCGSFVDEHPGGEEVMIDVGGQDATEAFEDVGHSDEAREILSGLLVGELKKEDKKEDETKAAAPAAQSTIKASTPTNAAGLGIGVYAVILVGGALAFFAYQFLSSSKS